jgi:hypothetical protein
MMRLRRNDAVLGKEAKILEAPLKIGPGPEIPDRGREEDQTPLFMKKENMRACHPSEAVQRLLGIDDRGEKGSGKGEGVKEHERMFS